MSGAAECLLLGRWLGGSLAPNPALGRYRASACSLGGFANRLEWLWW